MQTNFSLITVSLSLCNAAVSLWLPAGCWQFDWASSNTFPLLLHFPLPPSERERKRDRQVRKERKYRETKGRNTILTAKFFSLVFFFFFFGAWSIERCVSGIQVYLTEWPKTLCILLKRSEHLDCRWVPHFLSTRNKYLMKLAISESETENSLSHQVLFPHVHTLTHTHLVSQPPTAKRLFTAVVRKQSSSSTYEWLICL